MVTDETIAGKQIDLWYDMTLLNEKTGEVHVVMQLDAPPRPGLALNIELSPPMETAVSSPRTRPSIEGNSQRRRGSLSEGSASTRNVR
jgi:hypothetical protein